MLCIFVQRFRSFQETYRFEDLLMYMYPEMYRNSQQLKFTNSLAIISFETDRYM